MRAELKRMLRELADEGAVEKRRKKLHQPGTLPSTVLADITARDADGELIATPDEWDEEAHGPAPKIRIARPAQAAPGRSRRRRRPRAAARRGNRRRRRHPPSRPRHQDHRPAQAARARHLPRTARTAAGGSSRSTRKCSARSWRSRAGATARRAGRRPGRGRSRAARRGSACRPARVVETARLAQERARGQPDRHPRARHPARVPPRDAARSRSRAGRRRLPAARTGATLPLVTIDPPDAKDHDDAVHAEPDADAEQSRRLHPHRRHRRRRALRDARLGARPRGAGARQFGLFPRPRRADAAGAHLQRSVLAARRARTAPRSPCAW